MKLGLVVEAWEPQVAGVGRSVAQLAMGLSQRGHQITVMAARSADVNPSEHGVRLVTWPHRFAWKGPAIRAYARWASQQLAQGRFDRTISFTPLVSAQILHAWGGTVRSAVRRDIARFSIPPARWVLWGWSWVYPRRRLLLTLESRTLQSSDWSRLLVVSEQAGDEFERDYGIDRQKISLLPAAAQVQAMTPDAAAQARRMVRQGFGVGPEELTFLFLTQHPQRDGMMPMLQALGQLRKQGVAATVLLAGRAEYVQQHQAVALGVRPWVKAVGTTQQVGPLLCAADVLVLPTRYDVGSQAVLDAVAMGVPVIGSERDGSVRRWLSADGWAMGRTLKDGWDVSALSQAMIDLADPQARQACRLAALAVGDQLQLQARLDRMETILNQTVATPR